MSALVIGVGSPDGGDDAVGLQVAEQARLSGRTTLRVLTTTVPTSLLDLWCDHDDVVLIDAVRCAGSPGTVTVRRLDAPQRRARPGARGTHGFGVVQTVELARALHRLPRSLVLVGIEATDLGPGRPLSPEVRASIPAAVRAVLTACSTAVGSVKDQPPPGQGPQTLAPEASRIEGLHEARSRRCRDEEHREIPHPE